MEIMPEYMGYDRTIAVFSPDGRLFQVEYAKEAVKRGTTCVGIVFKDGVLLASIKPKGNLIVNDSAEKIFQIDEHIGAVAAGLLADARIIVNQARIKAQVHGITYEEPIDVWSLARVIGDRMQLSTLYAGLRPFGVSLLIAGTDSSGPHLIEADPSGMLYEWRAYSTGKGTTIANKILNQKWKPNMSKADAIKLASDIISKTEKEKKESVLDIAVIEKGKFKKLSTDELKKVK
jgi:proteasome alpha subunit